CTWSVWKRLTRANVFHLSLRFQSRRVEKFRYSNSYSWLYWKLFSPVRSSPGPFGAQRLDMSFEASGSQRFAGTLLPGNGSRTITLFGPIRDGHGWEMRARRPRGVKPGR